MNRKFRHRILAAAAIAALLAGGAATASPLQAAKGDQAQQSRKDHRQDRKDDRHAHKAKGHERKADHRQAQQHRPAVQPQRAVAPRQRAVPQQRAAVRQRADVRQRATVQRQRAVVRQQHAVAQQRHELARVRHEDRRGDRHERREDRRDARVDAQRRAYARYRQDYARRARVVHVTYAPRYYVRPAHYRYFRGGTWYSTSNYGADVLRQAVDMGYREGIRAGRADRMDGWPADYRDSIAWRSGDFGYFGRYISRADYAYYFRQGFQRGYDDGYFGRMQYGRYVDNDAVIAEAVIATILGLQLLR